MHCGAPIESILLMFWLCPIRSSMRYRSTHASHVFDFSHEHLSLTSFPSSIRSFRIKNQVIWHTIMSLALWIIWKAKCNFGFNNVHYVGSVHLMEYTLWCCAFHRCHWPGSRPAYTFLVANKARVVIKYPWATNSLNIICE